MPPAQQFVEALGGAWRGQSGEARCPAHDDTIPSLSISEGDDGRVLWFCHAGCSQDDVLAALRAEGLDPFASTPSGRRASKRRAADAIYERRRRAYTILRAALADTKENDKLDTVLERYLQARSLSGDIPPNIYGLKARRLEAFPAMVTPVLHSETGRLVGAHVTFLAHGGEDKAPLDAPRRMYGPVKGGIVPFGLDALDADDVVCVAEGIETALSVFEITGFATWAALSAANMQAISLPRAREIIVCADNDAPGLEAARALAERAARTGRTVRLAIPPGTGQDWNDAVRDTSDHRALRKAILQAPVHEASAESGLRAITSAQLRSLVLPPREMLLEPWLGAQAVCMVHAPRGVGKTLLAHGIAYAVACGTEFLDWKATHPAGVLYVDGEMPVALLQERDRAFAATFGEPGDNLRFVTPDLQAEYMPDLASREGQEEVDRLVTDQTRLIVVDSVSTLVHSGEENSSESWVPLQRWALRHRRAGRSVLFVHHSGKSGAQRGTSKREDTMDTVLGLRHPDDYSPEEGCVFQIRFEKARTLFGPDAAPMEVSLRIEAGRVVWTIGGHKDARLEKIADMLGRGIPQKNIAADLGISEGRVSQLIKEARAQGMVVEKRQSDDIESATNETERTGS